MLNVSWSMSFCFIIAHREAYLTEGKFGSQQYLTYFDGGHGVSPADWASSITFVHASTLSLRDYLIFGPAHCQRQWET